jgi:spore maturation protein A
VIKAKDAVAMNMTANLLGLGNAATPLGIEAMKRLKKISGEGDTATNEMITFVVLNTASIQLIPTTTAVLRAEYGSKNPMSIMFPVLFASVSSLIVGLIFDRVLRGKFNA